MIFLLFLGRMLFWREYYNLALLLFVVLGCRDFLLLCSNDLYWMPFFPEFIVISLWLLAMIYFFCSLYFYRFFLSFLKIYREYYLVKPTFSRKSNEIRLVFFFNNNAKDLIPSWVSLLLRRLIHLVQLSSFRKFIISWADRSEIWLDYRLISHMPFFERSS